MRTLGRPLTPAEQRYVRERVARLRLRLEEHIFERMVQERPELRTAGKPVTAELARRGQEEARARLAVLPCESRCPAARVIRPASGGVAVHCAVEDQVLSSRSDPQSLLTFCMGAYESCPSWRLEKEQIAATGRSVEAA